MRLSEAMTTGGTFIRFVNWYYLERGCGCFLGMAAAAHGWRSLDARWVTPFLRTHYPWALSLQVKYPCGCDDIYTAHLTKEGFTFTNPMKDFPFITVMNHLANHVSSKAWTPERFLDWVRSVEPQEEEILEEKVEAFEFHSTYIL